MEAAVNLQYFSDDKAGEDELELRAIIAAIHCCRERQDTAKHLLPPDPAEKPVPDDWSDVDPSDYPALLAQMERENIPGELAHWQEQLKQNPFFKELPQDEQEKWLCGKGLFKNGRYIGSQQDAGFTIGRHQRAERAGLSGGKYRALHRHLSTYVHTAPHALSQVAWFQPFDSIAVDSGINLPIMVCAGHVGLAIDCFLKAFPNCSGSLDSQRRSVLATGRAYLRLLIDG
jgi:hypothetical protein